MASGPYRANLTVQELVPQLFPHHTAAQWQAWIDVLQGLDIDVVEDFLLIDLAIWDSLGLPSELKAGLLCLRQQQDQFDDGGSTQPDGRRVTTLPAPPPELAENTILPAAFSPTPASANTTSSASNHELSPASRRETSHREPSPASRRESNYETARREASLAHRETSPASRRETLLASQRETSPAARRETSLASRRETALAPAPSEHRRETIFVSAADPKPALVAPPSPEKIVPSATIASSSPTPVSYQRVSSPSVSKTTSAPASPVLKTAAASTAPVTKSTVATTPAVTSASSPIVTKTPASPSTRTAPSSPTKTAPSSPKTATFAPASPVSKGIASSSIITATAPPLGGKSSLAPRKNSSSSEDDWGSSPSVVTKTAKSFNVVKGNKYGVKQNRVIVVDEEAFTLKFCDSAMKLKSEVPVYQVALLAPSDGNDKKVALAFKQRSRIYDIGFTDAKTCADFKNTYVAAATKQSAQTQRQKQEQQKQQQQQQQQQKAIKKDEFVAVSAHQEYSIVKKNKYKQRQQRFLVLKPTSLVLLDAQRKFKKAFSYEQINSLEIPAVDEKKNNSTEVEAFLLFKPSLKSQRPFQLIFPDSFDRSHFAQCLKSVYPKLALKDEKSSSRRFVVTTISNVAGNRQGKQRIIEVLPAQSVLRSYNRSMQFKDVDVSRIRSVGPCTIDPCKAIFTTNQKQSAFIFQDTLARARFLAAITFMLDSFAAQPPGKKVTLFVGTWNVDGMGAADVEAAAFVPPRVYDIYAITIQECPPKKLQEWVTEFQRLVGGHEKPFSQLDEKEREEKASYYSVCCQKFCEMLLVVLIRKELAYKVTGVECVTVACGAGDAAGSKGALVLFCRYEDTSLCFVACHLTGARQMVRERRQDILKIIKVARYGGREADLVHQCDHVLWFGDLNFRVETLDFESACKSVKSLKYEAVLGQDQLRREMSAENQEVVLSGFQEAHIAFAPTSRRAKTINSFVNKRDEPPSYTDRVLFHSVQLGALTVSRYGSAEEALGSDHRPVYALFSLSPRSFAWGSFKESPSTLTISMSELSLLSEQLDPDGEYHVHVSAPFLAEEVVMKESGFTGGGWNWWSSYSFRAFMEPDFLPLHHLRVTLRDAHSLPKAGGSSPKATNTKDALVCGRCSLPLLAPPSSAKFGVNLTKDGLHLGIFAGTLSVSYISP